MKPRVPRSTTASDSLGVFPPHAGNCFTTCGFTTAKLFRVRHLRWLELRACLTATRPPTVFDNRLPALPRGQPPKALFGRFEKRPEFLAYCAASVAWSTRTPTPIVLDSAILRRYTPLLVAGLAFCSASISADRFERSAVGSNDARPIVAWMIPALSTRN